MGTHEVLVAARNIQERRGYDWHQGYVHEFGGCCPGCAIAEAVGERSYELVMNHPAALLLADQFPSSDTGYEDTLSGRVRAEETDRDRPWALPDLLARYDRAIAATAPPPDMASLNLNENGGAKDWNALEVLAR